MSCQLFLQPSYLSDIWCRIWSHSCFLCTSGLLNLREVQNKNNQLLFAVSQKLSDKNNAPKTKVLKVKSNLFFSHFTVDYIHTILTHVLTCWQMVFKTYFAYTSKLAVSIETLRPSDMSSRPAVWDNPEPLNSASPATRRSRQNRSVNIWQNWLCLCLIPVFTWCTLSFKLYKRNINSHTQHKHSFENSKYSSNHDAVLGGGKKVAIARRPDTNWSLVCKVITPV